MPQVLQLAKENVLTAEQRASYTIAFIGCSRQAVLAGLTFAEAGFKVKFTDADQSVTRRLLKGNARLRNREVEVKLKSFIRAEKVTVSSDLKAVAATSDIIILTVDTKVDDKKAADYSEAESICKQVGATMPKGSLFIYSGVGGFGFTEDVAKANLENTSGLKVGVDFGLAYSPLSTILQQAMDEGSAELVVTADDNSSLDSAAVILETVAKQGVKRTLGIRTAELAALFDAVSRDSNAAMANELATFCEAAGVDYFDVSKLMNRNNARVTMLPTISEEVNRNEAYMLLENSENLNAKLRLPSLVRQVNEDMVRHAVNLTQEALRSIEKPLRRAKVALLGASLDPGTGHLAFVDMLEAKGAKVTLYDPYSPGADQVDRLAVKKTLNEATEGTDCVIVLSDQEQLKRLNLKKLRMLMKSPAAIVDLTLQLEPEKVQEAGFIYRGLGRGIWKK